MTTPLKTTVEGPRIATSESISSGPITLDGTVEVVNVNAASGSITVYLPLISAALGLPITVRKTDSSGNTVTVHTSGSDTIQGSSSVALSTQWAAVAVYNDGTIWYEAAGSSGGGGGGGGGVTTVGAFSGSSE